MPGITISVNSRSMPGWLSTMSSACEPLSASITVNCSSLSIAAVTARTPASSSTSRIVRSRPEIPAASVSLVDVGRLSDRLGARQIQPHSRAAIRRAFDLHVTARLLDEAVHHAQTEPGAVPEILGREERLDARAPALPAVMPTPVSVTDSSTKSPGGNVVVLAVRRDVAGLDRQRSAFGHRVAGIHGEIDQRGFDLRRICEHVPQPATRT